MYLFVDQVKFENMIVIIVTMILLYDAITFIVQTIDMYLDFVK